jgi:hypothetical protein
MTKTLTALTAAATFAIVAVAAPQQADARWRGGGGAGIVGGLAAGAIIGGALAGPRYYGYSGYQEDPYYGGYAYGGCVRQRVMTPYGWRWRRVC